jgi:hypothetical protein
MSSLDEETADIRIPAPPAADVVIFHEDDSALLAHLQHHVEELALAMDLIPPGAGGRDRLQLQGAAGDGDRP